MAAKIGWSKPRRDILGPSVSHIPEPIDLRALVDTGASVTCVHKDVIDRLGLQPTGAASVSTPSGTHSIAQYDVGMRLDGADDELTIPVLAISLPTDIGALIGRDVLDRFRFIYDGPAGTWRLDK
jgi:predicted aspartyl protease